MPNATFVGFTGKPVEQNDKNTRAVFGDYVSVYDIQRTVDDGATVPICYESRVIKMRLEEKAVDSEANFYDALANHEDVESAMGEDKLKVIATELVQTVRTNVSIDWHVRDQARAHIRRLVKRALRKYGYPPDLQDAAVQLVLQQAKAMAGMWTKYRDIFERVM